MPKRLASACLACLLATPGLATGAAAAPQRFLLEPGTVTIGFRGYGLGLLPIDGSFTRFDGTLTLDDADPTACTVSLRAETSSLRLPSQAMTHDALGPDLLDAIHYPELRLEGRCTGARLDTRLLLHGVDKPLPMTVTLGPGRWSASGMMHRPDWGMGARPMLAGPDVRISITAGLPRRP